MDNERLPYLREKTLKLPMSPGVYIMHDKTGRVIYVGKAKKLKNRVKSYFRNVEKHTPKVYRMVEHVWDFEFIVTNSEFEALILECSLIKQYSPKYNILLKDDKGYSYIRISKAPWSRITAVFESKKDDDSEASYIGPYISSFVVRQTVEEANKIFMLPTCTRKFPQEFRKGRPCLNFYIKNCMGLCRGKLSEKEYNEIISEAVNFIKGGSEYSVSRLEESMIKAAENEDFERAAILRDRIRAVQRITDKQKVVSSKVPEQDVIAIVSGKELSCAAVLKFRGGKLTDKDAFLHKDLSATPEGMSEFIESYYMTKDDIPKQITLFEQCDDGALLSRWLSEKANKTVKIVVPVRGAQRNTALMAYDNAVENLSLETSRTGRDVAVLDELARALALPKAPAVIEAYDISNFGAETVVGGMVVYVDAKPKRSDYKKFSMKEATAPNDYACMREMLTRRFTHYLDEKDSGTAFGRLPDLLLIDGGLGHVSTVEAVLQEMNINVPVFGMVKDDRHRTRAITSSGGEIAISSWRGVFDFVTGIQDEVHRFTISYSRKKHTGNSFTISLTKAPGIGEKRAAALLKHFKTMKALKEASVEEIAKAPLMNITSAKALRRFLDEE